jgi:sec-independent protein translocase protein TatB
MRGGAEGGPVFDSIGWGEIVVLALAALFIFGPERLPSLAKDAATGLKKVREAITGVRGQLHDTLGDDFDHLRDVDLRQYHPKTFIRQQLLADDDDTPVRRGSATGSAGVADSASAGRVRPSQMTRSRDSATPPPYDADAT